MIYGEAKVYFDGSHYIAIPHTTRPSTKRVQTPEEEITVYEENKTKNTDTPTEISESVSVEDIKQAGEPLNSDDRAEEPRQAEPPIARKMTRKELFEQLYAMTNQKRREERRKIIEKGMRPYFKTDAETQAFVFLQMERKQRNLISRRIRMCRKANLQEFNYFCTFTYDDKLHTEFTFKNGLKQCLSNFSNRRGWKYIGVWERSPKTNRLHFHGIFHVPHGTLPGMLITVRDYSTTAHRMQERTQSIYFNERFGRSDFEPIVDRTRMGEAMAYLMKYIEKSGEKIVYSKGLPQYFLSDIMEEDVVCPIGMEDQKLLLYDDFSCYEEGEYVGKVSPEVIGQMRKAN